MDTKKKPTIGVTALTEGKQKQEKINSFEIKIENKDGSVFGKQQVSVSNTEVVSFTVQGQAEPIAIIDPNAKTFTASINKQPFTCDISKISMNHAQSLTFTVETPSGNIIYKIDGNSISQKTPDSKKFEPLIVFDNPLDVSLPKNFPEQIMDGRINAKEFPSQMFATFRDAYNYEAIEIADKKLHLLKSPAGELMVVKSSKIIPVEQAYYIKNNSEAKLALTLPISHSKDGKSTAGIGYNLSMAEALRVAEVIEGRPVSPSEFRDTDKDQILGFKSPSRSANLKKKATTFENSVNQTHEKPQPPIVKQTDGNQANITALTPYGNESAKVEKENPNPYPIPYPTSELNSIDRNLNPYLDPSLDPNLDPNLDKSFDSLAPNLEPNPIQNLAPTVEPSPEQNIEQAVEPKPSPNAEQNLEQSKGQNAEQNSNTIPDSNLNHPQVAEASTNNDSNKKEEKKEKEDDREIKKLPILTANFAFLIAAISFGLLLAGVGVASWVLPAICAASTILALSGQTAITLHYRDVKKKDKQKEKDKAKIKEKTKDKNKDKQKEKKINKRKEKNINTEKKAKSKFNKKHENPRMSMEPNAVNAKPLKEVQTKTAGSKVIEINREQRDVSKLKTSELPQNTGMPEYNKKRENSIYTLLHDVQQFQAERNNPNANLSNLLNNISYHAELLTPSEVNDLETFYPKDKTLTQACTDVSTAITSYNEASKGFEVATSNLEYAEERLNNNPTDKKAQEYYQQCKDEFTNADNIVNKSLSQLNEKLDTVATELSNYMKPQEASIMQPKQISPEIVVLKDKFDYVFENREKTTTEDYYNIIGACKNTSEALSLKESMTVDESQVQQLCDSVVELSQKSEDLEIEAEVLTNELNELNNSIVDHDKNQTRINEINDNLTKTLEDLTLVKDERTRNLLELANTTKEHVDETTYSKIVEQESNQEYQQNLLEEKQQ